MLLARRAFFAASFLGVFMAHSACGPSMRQESGEFGSTMMSDRVSSATKFWRTETPDSRLSISSWAERPEAGTTLRAVSSRRYTASDRRPSFPRTAWTLTCEPGPTRSPRGPGTNVEPVMSNRTSPPMRHLSTFAIVCSVGLWAKWDSACSTCGFRDSGVVSESSYASSNWDGAMGCACRSSSGDGVTCFSGW